jgi:hypothetical protein
MKAIINLNDRPTLEQEAWLAKNVGPRLHWIHNSIGGKGWIAKRTYAYDGDMPTRVIWQLTFEDDRHATWFSLMF